MIVLNVLKANKLFVVRLIQNDIVLVVFFKPTTVPDAP